MKRAKPIQPAVFPNEWHREINQDLYYLSLAGEDLTSEIFIFQPKKKFQDGFAGKKRKRLSAEGEKMFKRPKKPIDKWKR